MIIHVYRTISVYFLFIGIFPEVLTAQSADNWWLQSSFADSVSRFKFHAGASYSYTRMKGVISGTMNTSNLVLILRKSVFTHFSRYGTDKMDLNLKSSVNLSYTTKSEYFTDYVDIDISRLTFIEGGYIWERDNALLLKNRNTFYGGFGLNFSFKGKMTLKSLLASGRINQNYTIPADDFDVSKKPYAAFYTVHDAGVRISPETFISGKVFYFTNLSEPERYRYGWLLNLSVSISKHVKLVTGYNYKYDRELKLLGLLPENITQNVGIEVSL